MNATSADLIASQSDRDGDSEIMVMDPNGCNQRQLTDNDAQDSNPRWSPDGGKTISVSNRDGNDEIYRMNSNGSEVVRLTHYDGEIAVDRGFQPGNGNPSWSPK